MPQSPGLKSYSVAIDHLATASLGVVVAHRSHAHQGVATCHECHPQRQFVKIDSLPAQHTGHEPDVAQEQGIAEQQSQEIATAVDGFHNLS